MMLIIITVGINEAAGELRKAGCRIKFGQGWMEIQLVNKVLGGPKGVLI
jgi:hypothetical protein